MNTALSFDDVLLQPKYSAVYSRDQTILKPSDLCGLGFEIPILSANMATVTEIDMIESLKSKGGLGVLHRMMSLEEQVNLIREYKIQAFSVGVKDGLERAMKSFEAGGEICFLDIAHAHSVHGIDFIREYYKHTNKPLVIGNIATPKAIEDFIEYIPDLSKVAFKAGVGGGCFAAGTRILMSNGSYKNIEDINIGDRVINKDGNPVNVTNTIYSGKKRVFKYKTSKFYKDSFATGDHLHWIGDYSTTSNIQDIELSKVLDKKTKFDKSKYKWQSLGTIDQSVMLLPNNIKFELPETFNIDFRNYSVIHKPFDKMGYPNNIEPSSELGYIFGTFLGDGNASLGRDKKSILGSVKWYFGLEESYIADKLIQSINKVFNVNLKKNIKKNIIEINFHCLPLARMLQEFGKKTNKKLPEKYIVNNMNYLDGIYNGLIDSDGNVESTGRINFTNTSPYLIELFGFLSYIHRGCFPTISSAKGDIGGLKGNNDNFSFNSKEFKNPNSQLTENYQICRIKYIDEDDIIDTYDIEVDCPTHSFIANNVIVHNSMCTTRIQTGSGIPTFQSLYDIRQHFAATKLPFALIADGGIKNSGDIVKALAVGADYVMIGSLFAGTKQTPGPVIKKDNMKYKIYRGSASYGDKVNRKEEGRNVEGEETLVKYKGSVEPIIDDLLDGIRSGMSYNGVSTIKLLRQSPEFVQITSSGLHESKAHGV